MQTTSTEFTDIAKGSVRPLSWNVAVSFDKAYDDTVTFFTLDTSDLDSGDMLEPTAEEAAIIQRWDYYRYVSYMARVQAVEWTRELDFPSSVSAAMADWVFENFNDYFTPNMGSPISGYILPKRPVRITAGFNGENLPQFIGLTEKMPEIDRTTKYVSFHAVDFLSQIYTMPLNNAVAMQDVRTDEVLAAMFEDFGLQPDQYVLEEGYNVIPYLYFESGSNAGNALAKLMEAEMGNLWLDETGVIRFEPRVLLDNTEKYRFNTGNVNAIKIIDKDDIINQVEITADIREVQAAQVIYTADTAGSVEIAAGGTVVFEAYLDDPAITVDTPSLGTTVGASWYTFAKVSDDTNVTTGVTLTGQILRSNNYVMFFSNANGYAVKLSGMELWGEPAKVVDRIRYTKKNQDSIDKYDPKVIQIENNFIQDVASCDALAFSILDTFSEYAGQIEMDVKGNPALQLGDLVYVDIAGYSGHYKIKKITNRIQEGRYSQVLVGRRQILRDWFELDTSELDGDEVLTI